MEPATEWRRKRSPDVSRRHNPATTSGGTRPVGSPVCPSVVRHGGRSHVRSAFTLIELLVVVAIIGLLAGFLLPALSTATSTARRLACISTMRQLALATAVYADDFAHHLPQPSQDADILDTSARGAALWFNALDPYLQVKRLPYAGDDTINRNYLPFKQCSLWPSFPDRQVAGSFNARLGSRTIKMNGFLGDTYNDLPDNPSKVAFFRIVDIRHPASTVLFFDGRAWDTRSATGNFDSGGSGLFHGAEVYAGLRHPGDSANVALVDGRVENVAQAIRVTDSGYLGWFRANQGAGQRFNWFRLGRGGVLDN